MQVTEPNPDWDPAEHADAVETLRERDDVVYRVWGADWCGDCRAELPDFFAALDAAGVDGDRVRVHEVDREKNGELTDEYDVRLIATVVAERDGEEVARFEESASAPAAEAVAAQLAESAAPAE